MRKLALSFFAALATLVASDRAVAADAPQDVIDKAISAQGGAENLAKFKAFQVTSKGTLDIGGMSVPFTAESHAQFPDQFKTTLTFTSSGKRVTQVMNRDQITISLDGKPQRIDEATRKEIKEQVYAEVVATLIGLKDPGFKLSLLENSRVGERAAVVVKVSSEGHRDVTLSFDKDSGVLLKSEQRLTDPVQGDYAHATVFSNYKDYSGVKRPTSEAIYKDGKKIMEMEVVEFKNLEKLPDNVFEP